MNFASKRAALYLSLEGMRGGLGGFANPVLALIAVIVMVSVSLFTEGISTLFKGQSDGWLFAPLAAVFVVLVILFYFIDPQLRADVKQFPMKAAKVMIWFLSPPGGSKTGDETVVEGPNALASWRMAFEAISMQMKEGQLTRVIVIASADATSTKHDGSFRFFEKFRASMATMTGFPADNIVLATGCVAGVDFENGEKLQTVMEAIYSNLATARFKNEEIIVDVTGGQKMPSILGGVVTLTQGRRLQYVSTRDFKIHEYDITYKAVG